MTDLNPQIIIFSMEKQQKSLPIQMKQEGGGDRCSRFMPLIPQFFGQDIKKDGSKGKVLGAQAWWPNSLSRTPVKMEGDNWPY